MSQSSSLSSVDAYEAGRSELVKLPQTQLHNILTTLLLKDGVNLTVSPYTAQVSFYVASHYNIFKELLATYLDDSC